MKPKHMSLRWNTYLKFFLFICAAFNSGLKLINHLIFLKIGIFHSRNSIR